MGGLLKKTLAPSPQPMKENKCGLTSKRQHRPCLITPLTWTNSILFTRSLGPLWGPTSSWRLFVHPDFIHRALRALRPRDTREILLGALEKYS